MSPVVSTGNLLLVSSIVAAVGLHASAAAATVVTVAASAPTDVSVTVYRAPARDSSSLDLDELEGFALVTETRTVSLPAGESRLRFGGVADGIQPQSALITGFPGGVREKNHDAKVLSPSALVGATLGRQVWLVRTNPKTGATTRRPGTLASDAEGVVFRTAEGVEALRCSGLRETFEFESLADTNATPTLSVLVSSPAAVTAQVRLSYLARGFDWLANYTATVSPDGKTVDLGAWVTLANGNGVSFPDAHTQVVAGRVNRESGDVEPTDSGSEIVAQCWPLGTTSDVSEPVHIDSASLADAEEVVVTGMRREVNAAAPMPMAALMKANLVQQEDLGDLKLYRVPERTSVTSRQIKQVRLLDRSGISGEIIYGADVPPEVSPDTVALRKLFRTRNDKAHHLGLPLPSGQVSAFFARGGSPLLVQEAPIRDVAENEELEIELGESSDVEVTGDIEEVTLDPATLKLLPLVPGVLELRSTEPVSVDRLDVHNARNVPVEVELRLLLPDGEQVIRADHKLTLRDGRPTFRVTVPAESSMTIRYESSRTVIRPVPHGAR